MDVVSCCVCKCIGRFIAFLLVAGRGEITQTNKREVCVCVCVCYSRQNENSEPSQFAAINIHIIRVCFSKGIIARVSSEKSRSNRKTKAEKHIKFSSF